MSFEHDIFISYAHVDNEESIVGDPDTRWVNNMRVVLERRVDMALGSKGATRIWFDRGGLPVNALVTPEIKAAVEASATMVAVFSRGYLKSDWCRQERELFVAQAMKSGLPRERMFLVVLHDLPRERWPREFTDLTGYQSWRKDPLKGVISRLADP